MKTEEEIDEKLGELSNQIEDEWRKHDSFLENNKKEAAEVTLNIISNLYARANTLIWVKE